MPQALLRILAGLGLLVPAIARADDHFEKSVRPILVEHCLKCHGPTVQKNGLRLDSREALLAGGENGPVLVPGKPGESRLIAAVKQTGPLKMPQGGKLNPAAIESLEQWIAEGAKWPATVKLLPPKDLELAGAKHWAFQPVRKPAVPQSRFKNPVDAFIAAKLADKKLSLSPVADKRTLLRRLTFDLHGLPPTPAELAAFEADKSPDAYEKLVDRLLASPRYGERWGRHWLDVARYADNKGYVFFEDKNYPWAWTYRDYVIAAFNNDLPFDQFILEQLAADQLNLSDSKKLAALGFLTIGGHFMGNTHDILDDRIDAVTRGFLGLTVTCARCHDHKFDPVPQADYYSLYGVFRSCTEPLVPPLWDKPPDTADYKKFAEDLAAKEKKLSDFVIGKHRELVNQARTRVADYLLAADAARKVPPADDFMLIADRGDLNPAMIVRWRTFLEATRKKKDPAWAIWHRFAEAAEGKLADVKPESGDDPAVAKLFAEPAKTLKEVAERYARLMAFRGMPWSMLRKTPPPGDPLLAALYGPTAPADAPLELDWGFLSLFPDRATQGEYQKHIKELETHLTKGPPRAMVLRDSPRPHDPRVFLRGQPNRLGDPVPRQFLQVLAANRTPFAEGSGRLELARSIATKDNPLTARVFVNRVWMHHFGRGLVNTPGDFGLRGDPPTHPELLDWLAAEFADGFHVKKLHRLIVTSETYRQASLERKNGTDADPDNRLLGKQNRRRLEFEPLHDAMLHVSGSLDLTVGGPSIPLFAGRTRRAVYGHIDRLEFPSLLATFDVPNPAALSPERNSTTVAPQALYLMNGPFSRDCAKRLLKITTFLQAKEPEPKLEALFRAALCRSPSKAESASILSYVKSGTEADRWLDLAQALLLTNEFAFVD